MSLVFSPNGLKPQGRQEEAPYEGGFSTFQLTTNNTSAIAVGETVGLVGGSVVSLTANPTPGTLSANTLLGVVMGFNYIAPAGQPLPFHNSQILPANAVSAGYTNISVMVAVANGRNFSVQANGPVTLAQIGSGINLGGFNTANLTFKQSGIYALRDFDYQPVVGWSKPGLWAYVDIVEYKFVFAKRSDAMLFKLTVE